MLFSIYGSKTYVTIEEFDATVKEAAQKLGMTTYTFERLIWERVQDAYDKDAIEKWLQKKGYRYTDDDVIEILEVYRSRYDYDQSEEENISDTYDYVGLNLEAEEDE